MKEQLKQNQLMQEELQRNYDNVTAYVKNGIANQADLDAVKVEQLNNIGSPDKPGGLSIQLCKSEKKEFYIRYSS